MRGQIAIPAFGDELVIDLETVDVKAPGEDRRRASPRALAGGVAALLGCSLLCGAAPAPSVSTSAASPRVLSRHGVTTCQRPRAPAARRRFVVVSRPYDERGEASARYDVWSLGEGGDLAPTDFSFRMGRAIGGPILFTPDGEIGIVTQADGSLGVFRLHADGRPEVLHAEFRAEFSAASAVLSPGGGDVYVLDPNWREHGGGIYRLALSCDGRLTSAGARAPAKLAYAMLFVWRRPQVALVAARELLDRGAGQDVFLLDWSRPSVLATADAFGDDVWIGSSAAMTPDGRYLLLADHNASPEAEDRVAVVAVRHGDRLLPRQIVAPVIDPVAVAISPFNNAALVLSGYGNALLVLAYDPGDSRAPFVLAGEPAYRGRGPRLPSGVAVVARGPLIGRVLVAENRGVRQLQFTPAGDVVDLGVTGGAGSTAGVAGAIGVQP